MIIIFGVILNIVTCIMVFCQLKKIWWSPIVMSVIQIPWIGYFLILGAEAYPMIINTTVILMINICCIKKWYKERNVVDPNESKNNTTNTDFS